MKFSKTSLLLSGLLYTLILSVSACSTVSVSTSDNFDVRELPDGSVVYLNRNSSISYDEGFSPRQVKVEGELFFSVVSGDEPFIVKSELGEITVLGTEFGVKTNEDEIEVEVEEGVVELNTKNTKSKVNRGENALFKKADKAIQKGKAKLKFKSWMEDLKTEFKKLGKEVKSTSKKIGKETKKLGKQLKKDIKKLKDN